MNIRYTGINGGRGGNHAVNIWGVNYDENGNITHIIIGDNNLTQSEPGKASQGYLVDYRLKYENGHVYCINTAIPGNTKPMGYIEEFTMLDLGTEKWEEWGRENGISF